MTSPAPVERVLRADPEKGTSWWEHWYCPVPLIGREYRVDEEKWIWPDEGSGPIPIRCIYRITTLGF